MEYISGREFFFPSAPFYILNNVDFWVRMFVGADYLWHVHDILCPRLLFILIGALSEKGDKDGQRTGEPAL